MSKHLFKLQWYLIGLISAWDSYLTVKLRDMIHDHEQNPVGLMLLRMDRGDVSIFMFCKFVGTLTALLVLWVLHEKNPKLADKVITPVFIAQVCLLYYLQTH